MLSPYALLVPVSALACLGAFLSFSDAHRRQWWMFPAMVGLSMCLGLLWAWAVRIAANKEEVFFLSLWWDLVVIGAYTVLPILAFDIELTRGQMVGGLLIFAGLIAVKMGTPC